LFFETGTRLEYRWYECLYENHSFTSPSRSKS